MALDAAASKSLQVLGEAVRNDDTEVATAFDNVNICSKSSSEMRIGKAPMNLNATAAISFLAKPGYIPTGPSIVPSKKVGDKTVTGIELLCYTDPSEWTLNPIEPSLGQRKAVLLDNWMDELIYEELYPFLFNKLNNKDKRPPVLLSWKLPPKTRLDLDRVAEDLHPEIQLKAQSNRIAFPLIPEDELTAVGEARVVLHLHHSMGADVFQAARLLIDDLDDRKIQTIFGDHATVDGLERNKESVIAAVAKISEDPECDIGVDENAANIVVLMLVLVVYGYTGRGDLHTGMAIVNLRVRLFDDLIFQFIRRSYPHLRGLSADKFHAKDYDDWRDVLQTIDEAASLEANESFYNASLLEISQTTTKKELVSLYKDFAKKAVFGMGGDDELDHPALTLHADLFMSRVFKMHSKAVFACCHSAKTVLAALLLPFFNDNGQCNYARLMANMLGSELTTSERKKHWNSSHTSYSHTNGAPGQGMDAHNEHAVEDAKEGGVHATLRGLQIRTRQSGVRSQFRAWGRSFVGWTKRTHSKKGIARLPSRLVIWHDFLKGMGERPETHARQSSIPYLQPLANMQLSVVPVSFLNMINVLTIDGEVTMVGYEGDEHCDINNWDVNVGCSFCRSPLVEYEPPVSQSGELGQDVTNDGEDESNEGVSDTNEEMAVLTCQACSASLSLRTAAMTCSLVGCSGAICSACSNDPQTRQLCQKTKSELKTLLKQLLGPGEPMRFGRSMASGLRRIREVQENNRLALLTKQIPELRDAHGSSPGPRAIILRVGRADMRKLPRVEVTCTLLSAAGGLTEVLEQAEVPIMNEEGVFEIKLEDKMKLGIKIFQTPEIGGGFLVTSVDQGSEAMRKGVRKNDLLVRVSGYADAITAETIVWTLRAKPAWVVFKRSEKNSAEAKVRFIQPENPVVAVAFYQPGVYGDAACISNERLRRFGPRSAYIARSMEDSKVRDVDPLGHAVLEVFLPGDTDAAHEAMKGEIRRARVDTKGARRSFFAIEPKSKPLARTTLRLMTGFFGGGAADLQLHKETSEKYISKTFLPSLKTPAVERRQAFAFVGRNWEKIKAHMENESNRSSHTEEKGSAQKRILAALAAQKYKEAGAVKNDIMAINMDWRRSTPEMRSQVNLLTEKMLRLYEEAKVASDGAQT